MDVGLLIPIVVDEELVRVVFDAGFADCDLVEAVPVLDVDLTSLGDGGYLKGEGGLDLGLDFFVIVGGVVDVVGVGVGGGVG